MFFIAVDDNQSGDSPIDLFADEQLLHHEARDFKPVIRAWSVRPKPKSEVSKGGDAQNGLQTPFTGLLDSALPIKTPTEPISVQTQTSRSSTDNSTGDERTTPTPAVMDNLKLTIPKEHTKPQTIVNKMEARDVEPTTPSVRQAQNMLVRSSNLGHIKTNESVTAAAAKVVAEEPTVTDQTNRTAEEETSVSSVTESGTVTKENLKEDVSHTGKPFFYSESTLRRLTPSPTPRSNTLTVTESSLGSTAHTSPAATTVMTPHVTESKTVTPHVSESKTVTYLPKISPKQTLTSVASLMTTTETTTTTTTSKPGKRKYSISWDEEEEVVGGEQTEGERAVKTVVEQNFGEEPQRKSGIAL